MKCGVCNWPIAIGVLLSKAQGLGILAQIRAHAARVLEVREQDLDGVEHVHVMRNAPALVCPKCYVQMFGKADWLPGDVYVEKWSLEGHVPVHAPQLCFRSKWVDGL